jgi:glutamyl-tRNA reductase
LQQRFLKVLKDYSIIAITHQHIPLEEIGKYHLDPEIRQDRLRFLKQKMNLKELQYLSTCNRVEFLFITDQDTKPDFLGLFFKAFNPTWKEKQITQAVNESIFLHGENAIKHLFQVAASLDSLVIGEREIITQVRNAYEESNKFGLSGDAIRLLIKKVIESSKEVFAETHISKNPVSVVSLAYRKLKELNIGQNARFLIIGAGATNKTMCKYLWKHGYRNFVVFNRTLSNAKKLAETLGGKGYNLNDLNEYKGGFDVMVACTAASDYIIDRELFSKLIGNEINHKVLIDLAIPYDIDPEIYSNFKVQAILIETLRKSAEENKANRKNSLEHCEQIVQKHIIEFYDLFRARRIEIAMKEIPKKVKEINHHAFTKVFAKQVESMDERSRDVLEQMMNYLEKKYISVPMKMAKEILLEQKEH